MAPRLDFHALLVSILGSGNVYFQPPSNVQMNYPAIVYARDYATTQHANNLPYRYLKRYSVTYIDKNPDSSVPDKIAALPMSTFERSFPADNLNHDIYNIYF